MPLHLNNVKERRLKLKEYVVIHIKSFLNIDRRKQKKNECTYITLNDLLFALRFTRDSSHPIKVYYYYFLFFDLFFFCESYRYHKKNERETDMLTYILFTYVQIVLKGMTTTIKN